MSNFALYMIGVLFVVGGVAYGAFLLGVEPAWIGVGIVVIIGLGIMAGVAQTRRRGPPGG